MLEMKKVVGVSMRIAQLRREFNFIS